MSAYKADGGENVRVHGPTRGGRASTKEQAMLRADAQRAVIREWLALPADELQGASHGLRYDRC
jgi:hypothetical protein